MKWFRQWTTVDELHSESDFFSVSYLHTDDNWWFDNTAVDDNTPNIYITYYMVIRKEFTDMSYHVWPVITVGSTK